MTTLRRALPEVTSLALVVGAAAVGVMLAPALPAQMIVGWHLGLDGQVSVTRGPRLLGLALLPVIMAGICGLQRFEAKAHPFTGVDEAGNGELVHEGKLPESYI